jgi:hypothetical protein
MKTPGEPIRRPVHRAFRVFVHEWLYVLKCMIGPAPDGQHDLLLVHLDQEERVAKAVVPGSTVVIPLTIDDALFTLYVRRGHGPVFDLELSAPRIRGDIGIKRLGDRR